MTSRSMIFNEDDEDRIIAAQIVTGQKELFRLLIEKYEKAVYGMGKSFFRNGDDALDFAQDVFLKTYRNLSGFREKARFSTWLYRIAYNTAISNSKGKKEYQSLAENHIMITGDTPERQTLRKLAGEAVSEAITELPERFKACVDLFFFYDRSYKEIELITGYPVNTVKSHIFRAKKLLREKLALYKGDAE